MEGDMRPVTLRYFLAVFAPARRLNIGSEGCGELRALAESVYSMFKEKPTHALDMLMQWFKRACIRARARRPEPFRQAVGVNQAPTSEPRRPRRSRRAASCSTCNQASCC